MKLFTTLLSLYILMLIAVPCIDAPEGHSLCKIEQTHHSDASHHNSADSCSPFCTCSCCVTMVVFSDQIIEFKRFVFDSKHKTSYLFPYYFSQFSAIWQPPQLS